MASTSFASPSALADGLAVVIPAFKGVHLAETLAAFAAQTDRRFRVYIGDDGSPEDLASIVAPFRAQLDLVYHRFPENLGHRSLAQHWDRAIALSSERWVWLFSDDDLVSPDCVAAFWADRAARPTAAGLLRFQSLQVGTDRQPLRGVRYTRFPAHETWEEYLRGPSRKNELYIIIVQNVIFPRELYHLHGGFYDYPLGLWSDVITWARFARVEGLRTLPSGQVFARVHDTSIGGGLFHGGKDRSAMLRTFGRMVADLRRLYADAGKTMPSRLWLDCFARPYEYSAYPLSAAERAAAAEALRIGWPGWPGFRELVFWSRALRPRLKQQPMLRALLRALRGSRHPTRAAAARSSSP